APARSLGNDRRQLLQRVAREGVAIAVSDAVELCLDGLVHLHVAVADAKHRRAARAVDILLPGGVVDVDALAPGDLWQFSRLPGRRRGRVGHGTPLVEQIAPEAT